MNRRDQYVALVASLPSSERLFFAKQPPLSRLRLDKRLAVLTPAHAETLALIERVMSWGAYAMTTPASEALARADHALGRIPQQTLRAIVAERMEVRALIAALRLRSRGVGPAEAAAALGRWGARPVKNWTDPAFGMGRRFPWLAKAAALVKEQDPLGLERHILEVTFRQLQRWGADHAFDFEAVVIYVLKWSIFHRWSRANGEAAARRFEALAEAALADFPDLRSRGGAYGAA